MICSLREAVEDAKDKITKLLEEYETGGVVNEACQCIRDLAMPFFNHEVVKKALVMAMEKKNDRMLNLLEVCFSEGLITTTQMTKGFTRIKDGLDDNPQHTPLAVVTDLRFMPGPISCWSQSFVLVCRDEEGGSGQHLEVCKLTYVGAQGTGRSG